MGWSRSSRKRKKKQILRRGAKLLKDLIECCDGKSNPIKYFSADEIRKATNNFSESNCVSQLDGSEDKWYSGKNKNHDMILIKKVVRIYYREGKFCRDIAISSMVSSHKNFLKLVGCCLEFDYPVMVYDGVKKHYKLDIKEQSWKGRMKIAEDIATALGYLHTAFPRPFVYTSMDLTKIFLDEDGVGKLSDFSNCVSIPEGETSVEVVVTGTIDYMDPRYAMRGIVSEETDAFSFGIVMQKLLMGLDTYSHKLYVVEEEEDAKEEGDGEGDDDDDTSVSKTELQDRLLKFMEEGRMDKIVDLKKMGEISEQELCQMKAFGMLSLKAFLSVRCLGYRWEVPTMVEVAKELKKIQRSLRNDSSSSPSSETQLDSAEDISSSILPF